MLNAQPSPLRFPQDILRFQYWVFFKPITLQRYIYKMSSLCLAMLAQALQFFGNGVKNILNLFL